ncbi:MAG: cadherin-like beta sandwich domain-containing protein, partial [Marinisporobacter sp.]|nr:cadherin-like beta sandwich domain-containing protein [Marinisporobacter sp.]
MLLTLVPPIAVYAAEESKLPDAVALSTVLEQEVNETNITVADSDYSVETSISVKNEITSVASSDFETEDNDARLYFYGTNSSQDSQENSEAVDLEAGKATKVYVKVIAADGSASSKYTINITRAKGEKNSIEADANGKGIPDKVEIDTVLGKELTIDRTEYEEKFGGAYKIHKIYASLPVGHDVEAISVSDIALKDQTSKIVLLDKIDGSGSPVDSISLEAGEEKTVSVAINAADMSINSGYYITISRAKKDDANDNGIPDKVEIDTILGKELTIDNKEYVEMGGGAYKLHKIYASLSVDHDVEAISVSNIALKDQTSK